MKVEMPWAESETSAGRHGDFVAQHAGVEVEHLEGTGFFGFGAGCIVAAGDQDDLAIVRRRAYLMREDAGVDRAGLRHFRA